MCPSILWWWSDRQTEFLLQKCHKQWYHLNVMQHLLTHQSSPNQSARMQQFVSRSSTTWHISRDNCNLNQCIVIMLQVATSEEDSVVDSEDEAPSLSPTSSQVCWITELAHWFGNGSHWGQHSGFVACMFLHSLVPNLSY